MITNQPESRDFEKQSIQYLTQALDLIISKAYKKEGLRHFPLSEADHFEVSEADHWKFHQGILNTSLTLIFLSLENYLKMEICKISPFLLLADEPKKWNKSQKDKEYSLLYIHQFDDLLVLYRELGLGQIDEKTAQELEKLRKKRNLITHGINQKPTTPKEVLETFHTFVLHIWGPVIWWNQLKSYVHSDPMANATGSNYERGSVSKYIDLLVSYLGKPKTGKILGISLQGRFYHCPTCWRGEDDDSSGLAASYAILSPNEPQSTNLYCVICDKDYEVKRRDCQKCDGTVFGPMPDLRQEEDGCCFTCLTPVKGIC